MCLPTNISFLYRSKFLGGDLVVPPAWRSPGINGVFHPYRHVGSWVHFLWDGFWQTTLPWINGNDCKYLHCKESSCLCSSFCWKYLSSLKLWHQSWPSRWLPSLNPPNRQQNIAHFVFLPQSHPGNHIVLLPLTNPGTLLTLACIATWVNYISQCEATFLSDN